MLGLSALSYDAQAADFPQYFEYENVKMQKLGEDRYVYKVFFKLYDAVLYTETGKRAKEVLERTAAFHLEFHYLREIKKSIILESADKILARNISSNELSSIKERIESINKAYKTVRKGGKSSLTYVPSIGTTLSINGKKKVTIKGNDFANLYLKIWFGEKPISADLKMALLGDK